MPSWFSRRSKTKAARGGEVETRRCPECGKTTEFRECEVETSYRLYHVVKLWDSSRSAFQCTSCDAVMELEDTEDPEPTAAERAQSAKDDAQAEREAVEARKRRAEEAARKQAEHEQAIDDELAALKKKHGAE